MSYLRGDWYAWADGKRMHLWCRQEEDDITDWVKDCHFAAGVAVPDDVFNALALMRAAELLGGKSEKKVRRLLKRVAKKHGGNFGSGALYRLAGMSPPWLVDEDEDE